MLLVVGAVFVVSFDFTMVLVAVVIFTVVLARFIVDITVLGFIHVESFYAEKDDAEADHQKSHRQHAAKKEWKYSHTRNMTV